MSVSKRRGVSKRTRYDVLRRFNFCCFYCGLPAGVVQLHIDHLIPRSHGGSDDEANLVAACPDCNLGKADSIPDDEMIQRARESWYLHHTAFGHRVIRCTVCAKPLPQIDLADDEEECTECDSCNAALCRGYEAGAGVGQERGMRAFQLSDVPSRLLENVIEGTGARFREGYERWVGGQS